MAGTWTGWPNVLAPASAARARPRDLIRLASASAAIAVGVGALTVAEGPAKFTTYAGYSAANTAFTLVAGLSLVATALVLSFSRRSERIADLAILAAIAWFAPVFVGWQEGPTEVRSAATLFAPLWFPLLVHAILTHPSGRLTSHPGRALVLTTYGGSLLAVALLALVRDPYSDPTCWSDCYALNAFLVHSLPSVVRTVETAGDWFAVGAAAAFSSILVGRLMKGSGAARWALAPIAAPGILLAAAVGAHSIALERVTVEDPAKMAYAVIFIVTSSSVILISAGLTFVALRTSSQRWAITRMVTGLGEAPAPGSLASALAGALSDPTLQIAYWLPSSQRYVDARGRRVNDPAPAPGRVVTNLVRGDRRIAVVSHAGTHPDLERELGPALRLGLENERLQAEVLAQLEEIRASRARIVETGDAERRRLERDLHDGAQQRLLALAYEIKLAGAAAHTDDDRATELLLTEAAGEARAALSELRELAHGIFPAILTQAGLWSALETLADSAAIRIDVRRMSAEPTAPPVEMAAYVLVVEVLEDAIARGASCLVVDGTNDESRITLTLDDDGSPRTSAMLAAADRIAAAGGTLEIERGRVRAELPLA